MILTIEDKNVEVKEVIAAMPGIIIFRTNDGVITHNGRYQLIESEIEYTARLKNQISVQKEIY